jgi:hypothetical protein
VILRGALMAVLIAGTAAAEAPRTSERPVPRGGEAVVQPVTVDETGALAQPEDGQNTQAKRERRGLFQSLRPIFRSRKVEKEARAQRRVLEKGAVCNDLAIQGEVVGRVSGKIRGCGVDNAVRVTSVSGVRLSTGAVMDCGTASALKQWMEGSAKPALASKGGGLKAVRVAAHYACRTRNNQRGAKLSEHAKGRAIDISAFRLQDGTEFTLLNGWNDRKYAKALRQMHSGACGPFGTVLGPNANKFHRDHFHFDTARYRSGSYCK